MKKLLTIALAAIFCLSMGGVIPAYAGTATVSVTKVIKWSTIPGSKMIIGTITPSTSYSTGGDTLNLESGASKLFTNLWTIHIEPKSGYLLEYDHTNKKVKIRYPTKSQAAATTAGNVATVGTALSLTGTPEYSSFSGSVSTAWSVSSTPTWDVVITGTAGSADAATYSVSAYGNIDGALDSSTVSFTGTIGKGTLDGTLDSANVTIPSGFRSAVDAGVAEEVASSFNGSSTIGAVYFTAYGN